MDHPVVSELFEAIADVKDVESGELGDPLYEYIDPDAIQLLASNETAKWTLSFELPDHTVTITSTGLILVDGDQQARWA